MKEDNMQDNAQDYGEAFRGEYKLYLRKNNKIKSIHSSLKI